MVIEKELEKTHKSRNSNHLIISSLAEMNYARIKKDVFRAVTLDQERFSFAHLQIRPR